jgi:hypothetical protein
LQIGRDIDPLSRASSAALEAAAWGRWWRIRRLPARPKDFEADLRSERIGWVGCDAAYSSAAVRVASGARALAGVTHELPAIHAVEANAAA